MMRFARTINLKRCAPIRPCQVPKQQLKVEEIDENKMRMKSSQVSCLIVTLLHDIFTLFLHFQGVRIENDMMVRIYIILEIVLLFLTLIPFASYIGNRKKNDSIHGTLDLNSESFGFGSLTFFSSRDLLWVLTINKSEPKEMGMILLRWDRLQMFPKIVPFHVAQWMSI